MVGASILQDHINKLNVLLFDVLMWSLFRKDLLMC